MLMLMRCQFFPFQNTHIKPPKSKTPTNSVFTIIKLKRGKSSYSLTIDCKKSTVKDIQEILANVINQSGGLSNDEDLPMEDGEDSIPVPESEIIDHDEELQDADRSEQEQTIEPIEPSIIKIATPQDKTNPYVGKWISLTPDTEVSSLTLSDYDMLAFSINEEPFNVVEAAYEE